MDRVHRRVNKATHAWESRWQNVCNRMVVPREEEQVVEFMNHDGKGRNWPSNKVGFEVILLKHRDVYLENIIWCKEEFYVHMRLKHICGAIGVLANTQIH